MEATRPTPNQDDKRAQIVAAARAVLARDGLAACTARAVADASPLTKSAIHYYFQDVDEIVDAAVAAHVDALLDTLRGVASSDADPESRFRAVIAAYLRTFADMPHAAFLWFEYWIAAGRRGSSGAVARMLDAVDTLLSGLLVDLGAVDATQAARLVRSWLLGTVVGQDVAPRAPEELDVEIGALLCGLGIQPR